MSVVEFHGTEHNEKDHGKRGADSPLSQYLAKMRNRPGQGVAGIYKVRVEHTDRSRGPGGGYNTTETEVEVDALNETDAKEQAYTMVHSRIGEGVVLEQRVHSVKPHRATRENSSVIANDRSKIVKRTNTPAPGQDNLAAVRASRGQSGKEPERRIPHLGETVDIYRDLSTDESGGRAKKRGFPDHAAFSVRNASGADGNSGATVNAATVGILLDAPRPAWANAEKRKAEASGKRGVHAFIRGEVNEYMEPEQAKALVSQPGWQQITYFPGALDFFDPATRRRFMGGDQAVGVEGKFFVLNPVFHTSTTPITKIERKRAMTSSARLVELWASARALQLHATHNQKDHGRRGVVPAGVTPENWEKALAAMREKAPRVKKSKPPEGWKPMMTREEAEDWARDSAVQELTTFVGSSTKLEKIKKNGFDVGRSGSGPGNVWGRGIYSSLDSTLEVDYDADNPFDDAAQRVVHFPSAQYKEWKSYRKPTVVRLKLNVKNPATIDLREGEDGFPSYDGDEMVKWIEDHRADLVGVDELLAKTTRPKAEDFEDEDGAIDFEEYDKAYYATRSIRELFNGFLAKNGYDALIVLEDGFTDMVGGSQVIVFDPKNVAIVDPETDVSHHLFASAFRLEQLRLAVQELQEFHGDEHNEKSHGRRGKTKAPKVLDVPSSKYGMKFSPSNAHRAEVKAAKAWKGWDDLPTTDFKPGSQPVLANEEHLQSKAIDKVVSGAVALREGYDPHILIDKNGDAHVIDGHHRVAMYMGLDKEIMPSKVWDERERGPIPGSTMRTKRRSTVGVSTAKIRTNKSSRVINRPGKETKATISSVNEARVEAATRKNFDAVQKAEQTATPDLEEIAKSQPGGHLIGLDFKFKSFQSIARKIRDKARLKALAPADVKITDSLRYTMAFDHDNFAASTEAAVAALEAKGYKMVEMENFWPPGDAYNGINALFEHPDGTVFELQFHTDLSFRIKDKDIHKFYEEFRDPDTTPKRKKELFDIMREISDAQPVPPEIERLCCLTFRGLD